MASMTSQLLDGECLQIFFTDDIHTFVMGSQRRLCSGCVGGHLQRYDQVWYWRDKSALCAKCGESFP